MKQLAVAFIALFSSAVHLYSILCITINWSNDVPSCVFNPLCTCSKALPDLGNVQCRDVPMPVVPPALNNSNIYTLQLQRNGLRHIEEMSFFGSGIWGLEISDNLITSLHANALHGLERSLRELNLRGNRLTSVPSACLRGFQKLRHLNLADNFINEIKSGTEFPASFKHTLRSLSIARNALNFIDQYAFKNLKSLEQLDLSGNNIHFIHELAFIQQPISAETGGGAGGSDDVIALSVLNLSVNRLRKIPFEAIKNITSLKVLDLSENLIWSTVDLLFKDRRLSLDELHLEGNQIQHLMDSAFENFLRINKTFLSYNPIAFVEDGAFKHVKMESIYLNACELSNISPNAWLHLENDLRAIDLSLNALQVNAKHGALLYNDSFNNLENLRTFILNENAVSYRLSPLSLASSQYTLQQISLKSDPQTMRQAFSPIKYEMQFSSVRRLSLTKLKEGKRLTKNDLLGYGGHNLEWVDLSGSGMEEIAADAFNVAPSIRSLNLSHNYIERVNGDALKPLSRTLQTLDLSDAFATRTLHCDIFNYLHSVVTLNLNDNDLQSLSLPSRCFDELRKLKFLSLDFNLLRTIHTDLFRSLPNLAYIFMSYNKLTSIADETFNEMENLLLIDLSYNHIKQIKSNAFSNLNAIETIDLEGNDIEFIEHEAFVNLPRLKQLNLSFNKLRSVHFNAFDQIGTLATFRLDVSNNLVNLESENGESKQKHQFILPASRNSVEYCDFSNNNITFINGSFFDTIRNTLTQLNLANNNLPNLTSSTVSRLLYLQRLLLQNNRIAAIASDAFRSERSLQVIDLSANEIPELPANVFDDTVNLRVLNLSRNQIRGLSEQVFRNTPYVESLDLSHNRFTTLPYQSLKYVCSSLRIFLFSHNQLEYLRADEVKGLFSRLLVFDISSNQIKQLSLNVFNDFRRLISLDLSHNPLQEIDDRTLESLHCTLEELDLAATKLRAVPLLNLHSLKKLNLSSNLISYIHTVSLRNTSHLQQLDIANNLFTSVPNNIWHLLPKLRFLDISGNPIQSLTNDSFIGLEKLEELRIKNLTLHYLQYGALRPISLLKVLHISYFQKIKHFSIGAMILDNSGLRELHIEANVSRLPRNVLQHGESKLTKKLQRIYIRGGAIRSIDDELLNVVESNTLELSIRETNISSLYTNLFSNLGRTRNLKLDVRDNSLATISDVLFAAPHFSKSRSLDVHSVYLSGNDWICDCRLAWVRDWFKQIKSESVDLMLVHSSPSLSSSSINNYNSNSNNNNTLETMEARVNELKSIIEDLRATRCRKTSKSLFDAFRKELRECRRGRNTNTAITIAQSMSFQSISLICFLCSTLVIVSFLRL